jgi:6-pyruvoyltetrahydropterin/6-carboxytetrahydropterin synthase
MFTVRKHIEIDAGHRVPYHGSKCRNLHGHRYRITAVVGTPELVPPDVEVSDAGMVVDFGVIKQVLTQVVHDRFDHKLLLWERDPLVEPWLVYPNAPTNPFQKLALELGITTGIVILPCIPTAEELARYWGQQILETVSRDVAQPRYWDDRLELMAIEVMETPTSVATWER